MIYAVFSDVHANVAALKMVLEDARRLGAGRLLCLGDIVGYGPQPAETIALVRSSGATVLAGNHDDAVSGRIDAGDFIELAGEAVRRHRESLSSEELTYLRSLPHVATFGSVRAAHGDFTSPKSFNYVDSEAIAAENFMCADFELGLVGHTHEPCLYLTGKSGVVYRLPPQDFYLEAGKRYLVNPGSVGYPRASDGQCYSSYLIYDSKARLVRFRFLPFSVSSVMQRGSLGQCRARKRPVIFAGMALVAVLLAVAGLLLSGTSLRGPETSRKDAFREAQELVLTQTVVKVVTNLVELQDSGSVGEKAAGDLIEQRSIEIPFGHRYLRANIRLASDSQGVQLKIIYYGPGENRLCEEMSTVKTVLRQRRQIPAGAIRADLTLSAIDRRAAPKILEFAPETEMAVKRSRRRSRSD